MILFAGCANDERLSGEGENCTKSSECAAGLKCVDFVCVVQDEPSASTTSPGVWYDPASNLTWHNPSAAFDMEWSEASFACEHSDRGGYTDWRLPTVGELRSLIRGCPAIELGGTCNVDEGECLEWSCRDLSCTGCTFSEGPDDGCYWPSALSGNINREEHCGWYWSSSPAVDKEGQAWSILFFDGTVSSGKIDIDGSVRCVR